MLHFMPNEEVLDFLAGELNESPEMFIIRLEEAVESGELSLEEAAQYIADYRSL